MFALIGVVQVQLLVIYFLAWLNFSWLGLAAASAIWLGSFLSLNLIDNLADRIFNRTLSYCYRCEMLFRIVIQAALVAGIIWLCQLFIPEAFAASWLNFQIPFVVSFLFSAITIGFISVMLLLIDIIPVTFKKLRRYFYYM